ncbi:NADPH:quinone reductase [Streptomyces sp. NPDC048442]|uniref:NADPH:quinone reductase n=1 Tax=Streptomyces sp. NPDC048442 TaxID=3154823 RepID=UPI0034372372
MLASWYDTQGPAADVLHVGELPDPVPGHGDVRVRVTVSGVNPGDTKKRRGWLGSSMPFPRVIPHSDAAGVIDAVGAGVDVHRVGQRVWVYGAQSYRPFGTAAQYTVVPDHQAPPLPDHLSGELGASLGIPGITAHRAVFADGPVDGQLVLVHGVLGSVGSLAAQLAQWAGATVIATVRRTADLDRVDPAVAHAVALDTSDPTAAIRSYAPRGVDRIIEVALSDNADLDNAVAANNAVIAAYATRSDRTEIPFWPLLFNNVTLRLLGSDDFPAEAKRQAARDLTAAAAVGALTVDVRDRYPLDQITKAHDHVDTGGVHGRILVTLPQ